MVSKSFIVRNGLVVGAANIDATLGTITTSGDIIARAATFSTFLNAATGTFTGYVTAATPTAADASSKVATTAFVANALASTASAISITDSSVLNASLYPLFASALSGSLTSVNTSSTKLQFNPSTGTLFATIFQSLSDQRLKTNVQPITDASAIIAQLQGVGYDWIDGSGGPQFGFIAQQVEAVLPEIVGFTGEYKTVNYSGVIPFLVEAMKQQQATIDTLTARVAALEVK